MTSVRDVIASWIEAGGLDLWLTRRSLRRLKGVDPCYALPLSFEGRNPAMRYKVTERRKRARGRKGGCATREGGRIRGEGDPVQGDESTQTVRWDWKG